MFVLPLLLAASAFATTLDESYSAALKRSETLSAQEKQALIADERYNQARGNILPNISANGSYLVQEQTGDPLTQAFFPHTAPEAKITLTQPIFRGLRELAALRQQGHLTRAEERATERAKLVLFNDVAHGYYVVLAAEQDVKNIENQLKLYDERITELTTRVRQGTSNKTDMLTLQASRANVTSQLENAKATVAAARESFVFLTGLPRETELAPVEGAYPKPAPLDSYLAKIESRPDMLDAKERDEAADEGVTIAKGAHYPSINFLGNYYFKRQSDVYKGIDWDVMFAASIPLFAGGTIEAQVRESVLVREQNDLLVSRRRRDAEREIRSLYSDYLAQLDSITALERSLEINERNYQLLKQDYRRGLTRNLDVLQALTSSEETRRALVRARYTSRDTWVQLQTASGTIPL
jgi:outer membrane protein